jgi:hypothetical protein
METTSNSVKSSKAYAVIIIIIIIIIKVVFDMIYLLNAIGLSPGGSTHLHTNNT